MRRGSGCAGDAFGTRRESRRYLVDWTNSRLRSGPYLSMRMDMSSTGRINSHALDNHEFAASCSQDVVRD